MERLLAICVANLLMLVLILGVWLRVNLVTPHPNCNVGLLAWTILRGLRHIAPYQVTCHGGFCKVTVFVHEVLWVHIVKRAFIIKRRSIVLPIRL